LTEKDLATLFVKQKTAFAKLNDNLSETNITNCRAGTACIKILSTSLIIAYNKWAKAVDEQKYDYRQELNNVTAVANGNASNASNASNDDTGTPSLQQQARWVMEAYARGNRSFSGALRRMDYSHLDFSGENLSGSAFAWAETNNVNFSDANLSGVNFNSANLTGANLTGADLTGAQLRSATLNDAIFSDSNLSFADFTRADLTGANLTDANLRGADISYTTLTDAILTGATFDSATRLPWNVTREQFIGQGAIFSNTLVIGGLTRA